MSTLGDIGADRVTGPESSDLRANSKGIRDDGSGGGRLSILSQTINRVLARGTDGRVETKDHADAE